MTTALRRRDFLFSSATLTLGRGLRAQTTGRPSVQPNIIFILADDLGAFDLGCYGQKKIKTPNIDKLAEEGMLFTQFYAGATVCAPSRSCLMTGQHTGHTTVRANSSTRTGGRVALKTDDFTLPEMLKGPEWRDAYDESRAYVTGMFGKWGLGEPGSTGLPNDKGFDEWFGFLNQQHAHNHYPEYLWRNRHKEVLQGNLGGQHREYACDLFTREALYFIDRHRYERFFLYLPYTVPHQHLEAPSLEPYTKQDWPLPEKTYAAMVTRLDTYVGQIIRKLKETDLDSRTLVFFSSDNGLAYNFPMFDDTGGLRSEKGQVYEGGIRVPMIVRWPGKIKAGSKCDLPFAFWDILPTIADVAGVRYIPPLCDGISFLPTLLGKPQKQQDRILYWESHEARSMAQAVRMGNWKAVRHGLDGKLELYDLSRDPGETRDVASANPQVVKKIEEYLNEARTDSPDYPVPRPPRF
jgi:arylsulfatase A-like enzyme